MIQVKQMELNPVSCPCNYKRVIDFTFSSIIATHKLQITETLIYDLGKLVGLVKKLPAFSICSINTWRVNVSQNPTQVPHIFYLYLDEFNTEINNQTTSDAASKINVEYVEFEI